MFSHSPYKRKPAMKGTYIEEPIDEVKVSKYYNLDHIKNDLKLEIKELSQRKELKKSESTLNHVHGFMNSLVSESDFGQKLSKGTIEEQAQFLYYSTLLFYYEFNVKLK